MSRPPIPEAPDEAEQRFRALYEDVYDDVLRFVRRRLPQEATTSAEDIVADALLVTWRRFNDAPRSFEAQRAWVFGIARNCLMTSQRGRSRREALTIRLADHHDQTDSTSHDALLLGLDLAAAWRCLSAADQEVLALSVLEDLTSAQAALVLETTPTGYRLRLMRARRALRSHLISADASEPAPQRAQSHPFSSSPLETTR